MAILEGKKAIIIGDRDGIQDQLSQSAKKTAGAEVVFSSTECFCLNERRRNGLRESEKSKGFR